MAMEPEVVVVPESSVREPVEVAVMMELSLAPVRLTEKVAVVVSMPSVVVTEKESAGVSPESRASTAEEFGV